MATLTNEKLYEDPEDMWLPEDIWLNEFRIELMNALFQKGFDVYKAREVGADRFVVMAELPTGRISKHYEMKDWDRFQIPEKDFAEKAAMDVVGRLTVLQRIRRLMLTKKDLLKAIKKIVVVLLILFGLYCIIVRFKYPELTETQLFFKVFGL